MSATTVETLYFPPGPTFLFGDDFWFDPYNIPSLEELEGDMRRPQLGDHNPYNHADRMDDIEYDPVDADLPIRPPSSSQQPSAFSRGGNVTASAPARSFVPFVGAVGAIANRALWSSSSQSTVVPNKLHETESLERSSGSPEEKILTPSSSSHQDDSSPNFQNSVDDAEEAHSSAFSDASPASSGHTGTDHVNRHTYWPRAAGPGSSAAMNNQTRRVTDVSGVAHISLTASSVPRSTSASQWSTIASANSAWMDDQDAEGPYDHFNNPYYYSGINYDSLLPTNYAAGSIFPPATDYNAEQNAYRMTLQAQWPYSHPGQLQPAMGLSQAQQLASLSASRTLDVVMGGVEPQAQRNEPTVQRHMVDNTRAPIAPATQLRATTQISKPPAVKAQRPVQGSRKATRVQVPASSTSRRVKGSDDDSHSPQSSSSQSGPTVKQPPRPYQTIFKAEPGTQSNSPGNTSPTPRKGGRKTRLSETAKQRTAEMRNTAACWKCVIQRDKCDGNFPCNRCAMRSQRAQTSYCECNRSKLPEFVRDFLPPTMTIMHEKQTIEDTVSDQVAHWNRDNPIDVYLTTGYGPPLRWRVYEFYPKTPELLEQLQYFQNPVTGVSEAHRKYSPPFALLKLDSSDGQHVEEYLEDLMTEPYLDKLGMACFEEDSQVDRTAFQCHLLELMCKLFLHTHDEKLRALLGSIIRMMIITYIMGHTLTISEDTLPSVLSHMRLSPRPEEVKRHTSPRLANRQLKFFFSIHRLEAFNEILKWQQNTFHTSGKKEDTWLTSFCAMLGLAMVLEEVQVTLQIQADAKALKGEMLRPEALREAYNACNRINENFAFLVLLFRWKYPQKKFGHGSFGPGSPEFGGEAERQFLRQLRALVEKSAEHLASRQDVECLHENQCQYTSRLVARFLLPFLTGAS